MLPEFLAALTVNIPRDGSAHALESERFEAFKHTELVPSPYFWLASPTLICLELHILGHLCLPESPGPLHESEIDDWIVELIGQRGE